jgi:adenylate kinase
MKVFVAGLSRSGKTSRSRYAAANLPDVEYVSVSQLLRSAGSVFPVETLAEGLVNQRLAADALKSISAVRPHRLIDGHALIETGEGPMLVPDWFFDELAPNLLICVSDRPEEILSRRSQAERDRQPAEVAALAAMERAACERVGSRLAIPVIALESPSLEGIAGVLRQHLSSAQ